MERTRKFLRRAKMACAQIEAELPAEKSKRAHIVALYTAYTQLPYQADKNDLIGIASAATLTSGAIEENEAAAAFFSNLAEEYEQDTREIELAQSEYAVARECIRQRIQEHPARVRKLQELLRDDVANVSGKVRLAAAASRAAKVLVQILQNHVARIVEVVLAQGDAENAQVADPTLFHAGVESAVQLLRALARQGQVRVPLNEFQLYLVHALAQHGHVDVEERETELVVRLKVGV